MMMLQTGGVAIFPVNRTSESWSIINIDFPPLLDFNPSPTTISRIASRWWLDPQQKSMKVRNIHTSVNLDYHATGQCVEWHQIGRESKRHVMIGISKAFAIWLLGGHVQLLWTNERIKGAYTPTKTHTLCRFRCNSKYFLHWAWSRMPIFTNNVENIYCVNCISYSGRWRYPTLIIY